MAFLNLGSTKPRRRSRKLKSPKRNATVKQLENYAKKMTVKIQTDQKRKSLLAYVDKVKAYSFS